MRKWLTKSFVEAVIIWLILLVMVYLMLMLVALFAPESEYEEQYYLQQETQTRLPMASTKSGGVVNDLIINR